MLNLRCGNVGAFTKQCNLVCEAMSLLETDGWRTMEIDSVESDCITLKIVGDGNTSSLQKVKVNDIGAIVCHYDMKKNIACWAFHNVILQEEQSERNLLLERFQISPNTSQKSSSTAGLPDDLRGKLL